MQLIVVLIGVSVVKDKFPLGDFSLENKKENSAIQHILYHSLYVVRITFAQLNFYQLLSFQF